MRFVGAALERLWALLGMLLGACVLRTEREKERHTQGQARTDRDHMSRSELIVHVWYGSASAYCIVCRMIYDLSVRRARAKHTCVCLRLFREWRDAEVT